MHNNVIGGSDIPLQFHNGRQREEKVDELGEEQQFIEICHSETHLALKNTLNFLFHVSAIELCKQQARCGQQPQAAPEVHVAAHRENWNICNTIRAQLSDYLGLFSKKVSIIAGCDSVGRELTGAWLGKCLYVITVGGCSIWLIAGAYLLFKHDSQLKNLHLIRNNIKLGEQAASGCALEDTNKNYNELVNFLRTCDWLTYLGVTNTTLTGIGVTNTGIVSILPIAFHYFSYIFLKFKHLQVDHLCFLLNPLAERHRIRTEINEIIRDLACSIQNDVKLESISAIESIKRHRAASFGSNKKFLANETPEQILSKTAQARLESRAKKIDFVKILMEIYNLNLVQPVTMTSRWHRKFSRLYRIMLIFSLSCSMATPLIMELILLLYDLYVKTNYRLETIRCQRWRFDGVPIVDNFIQLEQLNLDHEREAFRRYNGSLGSLMYLILIIEGGYYFSWRVVLYFLSKMTIIVLASAWASCFVNLFFMGHIDKLMWLSQLDEQICLCTTKARKQKQRELDRRRQRSLGVQIRHGDSGQVEENEEEAMTNLAKLLTIAYINYELFRRQQRHFKQLSNFLISQGLIFCAGTFTLCYFVTKNIETKNLAPTLFSQLAVISLMNIYLVMGSQKSRKVEKLVRAMLNLVIHASSCWPKGDQIHIIEMWRRQLLTELEASQFFTSSLLGNHVSYKQLIYFNSYILAGYVLLLRIKF